MHRQRKKRFHQSSSELKVLIYESEYRQIQAWTAEYQHLETGGDLFGLWRDDHTAVVQLVLGPGKRCRRTSASFYQDVDYLDRVGHHLTTKEGLCHIGEWHSHHRLGLTRPSGGDENTVWTNMRRYGIHRFCLFIATIADSATWSPEGVILNNVNVDGYHFNIDQRNKQALGHSTFDYIQGDSPFRLDKEIYKQISEGGENKIRGEHEERKPLIVEEETESRFQWFSKRVHSWLCLICYLCK